MGDEYLDTHLHTYLDIYPDTYLEAGQHSVSPAPPYVRMCTGCEGGETALMCAVKSGDVVAAKALLDAGADIDVKNSWGNTALHWAADHVSSGMHEMVKIMTSELAKRVV